MQNVFTWFSLTYEWTHVTPSSAFCSTTAGHRSPEGIRSPSANVRSTTYRGISLPFRLRPLLATVGGERAGAHRPNYPGCAVGLPILAGSQFGLVDATGRDEQPGEALGCRGEVSRRQADR